MVINPASQKEWDRQKGSVIAKRDRLSRKASRLRARAERKGWSKSKLDRRLGNIDERIGSLNTTIDTFEVLENSSPEYSLVSGTDEVGDTSYDTNTGNILISFNSTANFVHEVTHAGQFESGDIIFDSSSGIP